MGKCSFKFLLIGWLMLSISSFSACQEKSSPAATQMNEQLIKAVTAGDTARVAVLLTDNKLVNSSNAAGESLLLLATQRNNLPMVTLLVSRGAEVNQQANNQDSPFLYAGAAGYTPLLKVFLAHGARFDVFNRYHGTALIPACERGHIETVSLLANTPKFPIDHVNRLGWTALMEAVVLGDGSAKYIRIVEILIEAGVDKRIPDNNQITAGEHALKLGYKEIAQLLN